MTTQKVNFNGKCIKQYEATPNNFKVGDNVLIHLHEDGSILIYRPFQRNPHIPVADTFINSIEKAKEFFTCVSSTTTDVKKEWGKMMSDRYW